MLKTCEPPPEPAAVPEGPRQEYARPAAGRFSFRANFLWTFAGNVVYMACQWGMLVVLARLGSPEIVGQFALGLAVSAPVLMFTNLQLRGVLATDARREHAFADYLGVRLLTTLTALLVIGGVVLGSGYQGAVAAVVLLVGLAKAFESVSDIYYGLQQQHEQMKRIAVSLMIKGTGSLAALVVVLLLTRDVVWGTAALAGTWALVLLAYDLRGTARLAGEAGARPRWRPATVGKLVWLALPLGIVTCLLSLNTNIPRYFVEHQLGLRQLGIFAALGYLMVAGNTVVSALGGTAWPRLAGYWASGNRRAFRSLLLKLAGVGAVLGLAGVGVVLVAGPELLRLLYGAEYAAYSHVLLLFMVAAGIGYVASFLGYGLTAARYFGIQAPLFLGITLATVAACAVLVPRLGLEGAAWAVVCATVVHAAALAAVLGVIQGRKAGEKQ
jgi:O-antigen/teichoic acid export membrane protein